MTNEGNPEKEKRRRRRFFPSQLQAPVTTPKALARACILFLSLSLSLSRFQALTSFGVKRGLIDRH